jgi:hypothetical protein
MQLPTTREREREREREIERERERRRRKATHLAGCSLSERGEEGGPLPVRYSDDDSRCPMRATRTGPDRPRLLSWEVTMTITQHSHKRGGGEEEGYGGREGEGNQASKARGV